MGALQSVPDRPGGLSGFSVAHWIHAGPAGGDWLRPGNYSGCPFARCHAALLANLASIRLADVVAEW